MSHDSSGLKQSAGSTAKDPLVVKLEANKLRLGCTRDDYRTLQIIGKGSFGHVFLAYSIHGTQPHVAIKKIDKELLMNDYNVERLNSEITIHLNMNNENIVELYLYFEQHNSYYLVMEYCKGGDMYKFLKKQKTFNEAQSKHYLTQIVNALIYLQSFGVVHRDLKLSNILLTEDQRQIKISDFGLSTKLDSIDGEQSTILGTPNYMAYEIVNKMNYGMKVDNWSLGCILFTFLVGESPFDEGSRTQTFDKIRNLDYKIPDFVSKNARDLIEKLLHPDPTKRISLIECKSHPFLKEAIPKPIQTNGLSSSSRAKTQEEISTTITKTPFNTIRIKPFTHKKNDIHIEINETGNVFLTFNNGERRFIVSGDGRTIWYEKKASRRKEFSFFEMPSSVEKYYEYARNLIDTIKSKTPKIIYLDTDFKCIQMENHPFPDYETSLFPSGIRMVYQRRKSMVVVKFSKERSVSINLNKDLTLFKEEMDLTDNHKIVKVEGSLTVEESEILFNNSVLWSSLVHVKKGIDLIEQAERDMAIDSYPFFINATSNTSGPLSPTLSDTSTTSSNNSSALNRCLLSSLSFSTNNSESNPPDDNSFSNQHFY